MDLTNWVQRGGDEIRFIERSGPAQFLYVARRKSNLSTASGVDGDLDGDLYTVRVRLDGSSILGTTSKDRLDLIPPPEYGYLVIPSSGTVPTETSDPDLSLRHGHRVWRYIKGQFPETLEEVKEGEL